MAKHIVLLTGIAAFFASLLQGQTQKPERTGTLRGVVVRQDTNEPISGVRIAIGNGNTNAMMLLSGAQMEQNKNARNSEAGALLLQMTANSIAGSDTGRDFSTVTDKDGRFSFEGIPSGEFPVSAERDGYVGVDNKKPPPVARATTSVAPGQTTEIILRLIPGASISGRIIDANGNASANATVEVLRRADIDGTLSTEPFTERLSDDRGEYRAFQLPPGEYFLAATPGESRSQRSAIRTFYPNAADISASTSVKVEPGDDLRGINIQIRFAPTGNSSPASLPKD